MGARHAHRADVAQQQSNTFVKYRLWVQIPPSAHCATDTIDLMRLLTADDLQDKIAV